MTPQAKMGRHEARMSSDVRSVVSDKSSSRRLTHQNFIHDGLGESWSRATAIAMTVLIALIAASPIIWLSGATLGSAVEALFTGSWGSPHAISETLVQAIPLLISALAFTVTFRAGLFNIGIEGQLVAGGCAAGVIGATATSLPGWLLMLISLATAMLTGALWTVVPALLKAYRGVHEVVTTIMLNYIAFGITRFLVSPDGSFAAKAQPSATEKIPASARLPILIDGTRLHAGLICALVAALIVGWVLFRTPAGFKLRLVGENRTVAEHAGISTRKTLISAFLASGALAGLAGGVQVLGLYGRFFNSFSPGYGFDAIAVALLGGLTPVGIVLSAVFFGTLDAGSVQLQAVAGISREFVTVVSGLVVACIVAQPLLLRAAQRISQRRTSRSEQASDV